MDDRPHTMERDYRQLLPRAIGDLATASYAGVFIYLTLFVTIIYSTGYQTRHPSLTLLCVSAMALTSLARLYIARASKHSDPAVWVRWFSSATLLMVTIWSIYWSYAIHHDGLNQTTLLSIVASVGIASAGVGTLAPISLLSLAVIALMLWPSGVVLSTLPNGVGMAYAIMCLVGWLFLSFVALRINRQYWAMHRYAALLEQRAEQLAEATNAKSAFLARMSHELRTPLNGMLGMAQLLKLSDLDPVQREYAGTITKSGKALRTIIDDILDLSKIEAGKLELSPGRFDLAKTVHETLDLLAPEATARGLALWREITDKLPPRLLGDAGRIRQILTNLVGNAIKFTDEGSVTVRVSANEITPEQVDVCIEVSDTGAGIPQETCEHIFEAFNQAESGSSPPAGGTGLGLSITRQLVDMMNGSIHVDSRAGYGSVFTVHIPLPVATQETENRDSTPSPSPVMNWAGGMLVNRSILVAEDNPVNQLFTSEVLKSMGCRVTAVNDGLQAVEAFMTGHYDAILMDMQMPNLDGLGATRAIRAAENASAHTPIIAVTANALKGDCETCLAAGVDDFISKPFDISDLQAVLEHWIIEQNVNERNSHMR
ncbi:MAG: response regulator [Gammaproteobacteria bacterium]|nr:response regulator [Gammaproteobacteria bacterium]